LHVEEIAPNWNAPFLSPCELVIVWPILGLHTRPSRFRRFDYVPPAAFILDTHAYFS